MSHNRTEQTESASATQGTSSGRGPEATFPRHSLKQALKVAEAIWSDHQGDPYDLIDLAGSLNTTPQSSSFRMLLTSSSRYGLTNGSYKSPKISLTPLGSAIVAPTEGSNQNASLRGALLNPELYSKLFPRLDRKQIPREDVLKNTLMKEFGVPKDDVDTAYKVIMQNISDYNLSQDLKGNIYFQLDRLASGSNKTQTTVLHTAEEMALQGETETGISEETPTKVAIAQEQRAETIQVKVPRVFISHSKNKTVVSQIKEMLDFGKFQYEVGEERESLAIPISEKVFGLMEKCNCAIINISADEERKQKDDTYAINENVLTEIGAAYLHYNRRVILLIDNRLVSKLPSNIRELASIRYEGNELSWSAGTTLQKTLAQFRDAL